MRLFAGLQQGPVPDEGLFAFRPDNLNPEMWGGDSGGPSPA